MSDFLLELRSEEIPARMQVKAKDDLARLFAAEIAKAGLVAEGIETFATPRRLALIARGLPGATQAVSEETKGPKASAPPQALEGFLRKTGLTREQLVERDGVLFAVIEKPGRPTPDVLAEAIPAIVRAFPWPKSMRWGTASASTESLRWVRPLQGIVALFGQDVVPVEIDGIASGRETMGHRFHHAGPVIIANPASYAESLRAAHVILHLSERIAIIREGAARLAAEAGLQLVEDEGLVLENAGLTEWPVPLLGHFDPAFLDVPPEVIQLTARVNQKYFVLQSSPAGGGVREADGGGKGAILAPHFICVANIDATDGGKAIVAGNERVLSARLSDAKFFWDNDLKVPLEAQAEKLKDIVFHEKLGTVADKVERVAKLARWLCEEGIIKPSPERGGGPSQRDGGGAGAGEVRPFDNGLPLHHPADGPPPPLGEDLAALAERAAKLCKADLVTGMVGEFPELQGVIGGYLAAAGAGGVREHPAVVAAIRDHYKPVGQGDDVPTDPVTVAVSLADKLDTLLAFFGVGLTPTGSKDPFALRRAALAVIALITSSGLRLNLFGLFARELSRFRLQSLGQIDVTDVPIFRDYGDRNYRLMSEGETTKLLYGNHPILEWRTAPIPGLQQFISIGGLKGVERDIWAFLAERLKVQQREAGVRHDLIDAVFALGGEDDLVRLLARVKALQAFVGTDEGANLLAGYKRAANILKKSSPERGGGPPASSAGGGGAGEGGMLQADNGLPLHHPSDGSPPPSGEDFGGAEATLIAALDLAEPRAAAAIAAEEFEAAMSALATLRAPIDQFFEHVTVNDADESKRAARLALLARVRDAVHTVADFSKIEG